MLNLSLTGFIGNLFLLALIAYVLVYWIVRGVRKFKARPRRTKVDRLSQLQNIEDTVIGLRYRMDALEAQNEKLTQELDMVKDGVETANGKLDEIISYAQPLDDEE